MNPLTHAIKFATHAYRTHAHTPNARNDISSLTILAILRKLPLELPTDIYVAAVLHDTLKDAKLTMADITHHYGASVAFLVDALTKNIERHPGVADRVHEKRYLSRLMDVAQHQPMILLIILADRIHTMRTLADMPIRRQVMTIGETIELYMPFFNEHIPSEHGALRMSYLRLLNILKRATIKAMQTHDIRISL